MSHVKRDRTACRGGLVRPGHVSVDGRGRVGNFEEVYGVWRNRFGRGAHLHANMTPAGERLYLYAGGSRLFDIKGGIEVIYNAC